MIMRFAGVISLLVVLAGCGVFGQESEIEIQFGGYDGFQEDFVRIWTGDLTIFADTVSSAPAVGVWAFETRQVLPRRRLEINVQVNDLEPQAFPFDTRTWRALWIDFERSEERVVFTMHPYFFPPEG